MGLRIAGIDPGLSSGAMAIVEANSDGLFLIDATEIPTIGEDHRKRIDVRKLSSWLAPLKPDHAIIERAQVMPQIADENDLVVLSRFESDATAQGAGFIDMVIPYVALKPVRDLLRSRVQTGDGNEESDKVWRSQLADAVKDADLEIQILLGKLQLSLQQLQSMQAGDVLPFKKPESARALIQDMPVYDVEVGALGSQVAVKIVQAISPNTQA